MPQYNRLIIYTPWPEGRPISDEDGDGVCDADDKCPGTPAGDRVGPFGCSCDVVIRTNFAFDSAGNVVASDDLGNLVTIDPSGRRRLFVPNAADFIAGIRYLPSGDLIYLDAALGDVVRVSPSGSRRVILSGLLYPNGLEILAPYAIAN